MIMLPGICPICKAETLQFEPDYAVCTSCVIYRKKLNILQQVLVWASTHYWWWRVPILLWFLFTFSKYVQDSEYVMNRIANVISGVNFGVHELGHFLFIPFGEFMTILGGSLLQVLFPLIWFGIALHRKWFFAATMMLCWTGLSLIDVSIYAADAQVRLLPLVTLNSDYDEAHDWYQILTRLNMLEHTDTIARMLRLVGMVAAALGLILGAVLLLLTLARSLKGPLEHSNSPH